ncbi:MAG TPA: dTDP-4-dehydrorhamnose reductase [Candidatus Acidoferrales bacterium]|nr:dTDP-4-dehydrorhamnose reductase [Candidatus Acidoferrales bacterium]
MRFLILGAGGQLATALEDTLAGESVLALAHEQADICDALSVGRHARGFRPEFVINTAAYHRVDECEGAPGPSFAVNAAALAGLAGIANELDAALVHFSTDYVFDGARSQPYRETDPPNPLSVYGISKLAGEQIVCRYARRYFLVRTCGLYGRRRQGSKSMNFVERMLRLAEARHPIRVVNDQVLTPTSAKDLAEALAGLLATGKCGLYHMTNAGQCSWHEFAQEIFRLAGLPADLEPVSRAEYGAKAKRPAYSVLAHRALREAGRPDLRPWQEALADYLRAERQGG